MKKQRFVESYHIKDILVFEKGDIECPFCDTEINTNQPGEIRCEGCTAVIAGDKAHLITYGEYYPIKEKALYWADPMITEETVQEEFEKNVLLQLHEFGFHCDAKCIDLPPSRTEKFDILFFDYGGVLPGSGSLIEASMRNVVEMAEEYPDRIFVMVSTFTRQSMEDFLTQIDDRKYHNIHLDIESFCRYYMEYYMEKDGG